MKKISKFKRNFYILSFIFFAPVGLYALLREEKEEKEKKSKGYNNLLIFFNFKAFFDAIIFFENMFDNRFLYPLITFAYTLFWLIALSFMCRKVYYKK